MREVGKFIKRGENVPRRDVFKAWGDNVVTFFAGAMTSNQIEGGYTVVFHARVGEPFWSRSRIVSAGKVEFKTEAKPDDIIHVRSSSGALLFRSRGENLPLASESLNQPNEVS